MTGRPAATLLHTGPGLANGLANLHNARRAAHADHQHRRRPCLLPPALDAPLTTDIEILAAPMSRLGAPRRAAPATSRPAAEAAYRASLTPPGVATLILPADAAWGEVAGSFAAAKRLLLDAPACPIRETVRAVGERASARIRAVSPCSSAAPLREPMRLHVAGRIAAACERRGCSTKCWSRTSQRGARPGRVDAHALSGRQRAGGCFRDIDVLVLVGAPEPVAFFAYPGKPSRLVPRRLRRADPGRAWRGLEGRTGSTARRARREVDAAFPGAARRRRRWLCQPVD